MIIPVKASMGKFDNILFRMKTKLKLSAKLSASTINKVPVIINNFNRLDCLVQQINWLEKAGLTNIYIIDNASSYPPLLAFYQHTPYTVLRLDKNIGFLALWKTIIFQRFRHDYYVYSDPDIIPVDECPPNAVNYFFSLLNKYPQVSKAGFGLMIDDLPEHYPLKNKVTQWERKFWIDEIAPGVFVAPIDTTFALYRPGVKGGSELNAVRTGWPYIARHLSWYADPLMLSEEEQFYMSQADHSASWSTALLGNRGNNAY